MTTNRDIAIFKKDYCSGEKNRNKMLVDFQVSVESFEEVLFGQCIKSYATGERTITGAFMILKVVDEYNDKIYHPVFSEKVARDMLRNTNIKIPGKLTIFINESCSNDNSQKQDCNYQYVNVKRKQSNAALMHLIALTRAFMIFKMHNPTPMNGVFKKIYDKLYSHPNIEAMPADIKSINTALGRYIDNYSKYYGFMNLNDFIRHIQNNRDGKRLKDIDLEILHSILMENYPQIEPYF